MLWSRCSVSIIVVGLVVQHKVIIPNTTVLELYTTELTVIIVRVIKMVILIHMTMEMFKDLLYSASNVYYFVITI